MEQSRGWGADSFSSSQIIRRMLRKASVDYCIERFPPLVPVLSQNNPVFNAILCLQDPFWYGVSQQERKIYFYNKTHHLFKK
jgi:hypothetical protein